MKNLLIVLCLSLTILGTVKCANKCYECYDCPIPFNVKQVNLKSCASSNFVCQKIESSNSRGKPSISRACVAVNTCEPGKKNQFGVITVTTCCNTDLCNDAGRFKTQSGHLTVFLLTLISFLCLYVFM